MVELTTQGYNLLDSLKESLLGEDYTGDVYSNKNWRQLYLLNKVVEDPGWSGPSRDSLLWDDWETLVREGYVNEDPDKVRTYYQAENPNEPPYFLLGPRS